MSRPAWDGKIRGMWPALATPFTENAHAIDYASVDALLDYQLSAGVDGLVIAGSTGEAATLSDVEYGALIRYVVQRVEGRVPCIAGVGSSGTARASELALRAVDSGAEGILLVAPPYNKPTQQGIIKHYEAVHATVQKPLIGYNIPGRSGVSITPATIATLFEEGFISGLKDASGSLDIALDILAAAPRLPLLAGDDSYTLAVMAHGAAGVISATANVAPKSFVRITSGVQQSDWEKARAAQMEVLPLIRLMFRESNPIPVKTALWVKGIIKYPTLRLPLTAAEPSTEQAIRDLFATRVFE